MAKKFICCKRASSSMAERKNLKERICRKRIATFLSLMGFQDDNPDTTKSLLKRLKEIKEKEPPVVAEMGSTVRKVTFKFKLKESLVEKIDIGDHHKAVESKGKKPMKEKDSRKFSPKHPRSEIDSDDHKAADSKGKKPMIQANSRKFSKKRPCSEIDHGVVESDQSVKAKRMKVVKSNENCREAVRELSEELRNLIRNKGGSEPEFVTGKTLSTTDVNSYQGRLLMPVTRIEINDLDTFFTREEKRALNRKELSILVIDPESREFNMNLGIWNMSSNVNYALKKEWNKFVTANKLEEGMVIQVWSFRAEGRLCFVLFRV